MTSIVIVMIDATVITIRPDFKGIETFLSNISNSTVIITIRPDFKGIETL